LCTRGSKRQRPQPASDDGDDRQDASWDLLQRQRAIAGESTARN
jgi:hypothetical protein